MQKKEFLAIGCNRGEASGWNRLKRYGQEIKKRFRTIYWNFPSCYEKIHRFKQQYNILMFWKGQKYRNQSKYYISKTSSSFAETSMRENSTWLNTSPYQCCVCAPSLNLTDWGHFNEYLHFAPSHTLNVGVITYNCIAGGPVTRRLFNKEILWEFPLQWVLKRAFEAGRIFQSLWIAQDQDERNSGLSDRWLSWCLLVARPKLHHLHLRKYRSTGARFQANIWYLDGIHWKDFVEKTRA